VKDKKSPRIYLAGPISGCNEAQLTHWRRLVKERHGDEFEFIDPAEDLVQDSDAPYQVVERDVREIRKADAVLANMWRESIGTAIGIATARMQHKPVVVVDSNHIGSRMLAYYADSVVPDLHEAIKRLRLFMKFRPSVTMVVKRDRPREAFDPRKLAKAIREACRAADCDDLLLPLEVVPETMRRLAPSDRGPTREVTTTRIRQAVWDSLAWMESEPQRHVPVVGVRQAWENFEHARRRGGPVAVPAVVEKDAVIHARPLEVTVSAGKSHACIWGAGVKSLDKIPGAARKVFEEICRVDGISYIRLTASSEGPREGSCRVSLMASKNKATIEGKCYDPQATRGRAQSFQVLVHDAERTEVVLRALRKHMGDLGLLRGAEDGAAIAV